MTPKRPRDPNQLAKSIVESQLAKSLTAILRQKNRAKDSVAVALGKKGGKARANSLLLSERREIASQAAASRWKKD